MPEPSRVPFHRARLGRAACAAFAIALVTALGCSNPAIKGVYDPTFDFDSLHTYGIRSVVPTGEMSSMDAERVSQALNLTLGRKGYHESSDPDFLVAAHYLQGAQAEPGAEDLGYTYALGSTEVTDTGTTRYDEGALAIDFVSTVTNAAVWRGVSGLLINETTDPLERGAKIEQAVEDIIGRFPRSSRPDASGS